MVASVKVKPIFTASGPPIALSSWTVIHGVRVSVSAMGQLCHLGRHRPPADQTDLRYAPNALVASQDMTIARTRSAPPRVAMTFQSGVAESDSRLTRTAQSSGL